MQTFAHGGNIYKLAQSIGQSASDLLDFSANINPLGAPKWIFESITSSLASLLHYPEPYAAELIETAASFYQVNTNEIVAGNGSTEILYALPQVLSLQKAVIPVPAYVDYQKVCLLRHLDVDQLPLRPENNFVLDLSEVESRLSQPSLVFLGQPNNPTGQTFSSEHLRLLAQTYPESVFVIDEAFADFIPGCDRLYNHRPDNVIVLLSLTKFYAIPGLRLGLAIGSPWIIENLRQVIPPWSANYLAQKIGIQALTDISFQHKSRETLPPLRDSFFSALNELKGLKVFPSQVNFFLCKLVTKDLDVPSLAAKLLKDRIAIRNCENFPTLDRYYFRIAVRSEQENKTFLEHLSRYLDPKYIFLTPHDRKETKPGPLQAKPPAFMLQGTSSNAGKSILATALCRILLQDGYRVAPFKAQNMSLNSFVTRNGGEMGRAQVLQAQACRLEPDVRMNPVLLKPSSDTGSQVIVWGKPVKSMDVQSYITFKKEAKTYVCQAYDELSQDYDVLVLEGAGSPAEINLKPHDLTNMFMAHYANANVFLVGDIDRGGVFASFVGTMELLDLWEKELLAGFVINRFRGQKSLLDSAISFTETRTKRPVFGVVPYIKDLGLPEEDSVSFKTAWEKNLPPKDAAHVTIGCIDLPHISNFTDLDPLLLEPDVRVLIVKGPQDLETIPDIIILPGSKNVISDLQNLHQSHLKEVLYSLVSQKKTELVGICGGFQMLGQQVADPYGIESHTEKETGLGLLPVITELGYDKTLTQVIGWHHPSKCHVHGYEIHHGSTYTLNNQASCVITTESGREIGFANPDGSIWGTYLHGLFDNDQFRRWFIDRLRQKKGFPALKSPQLCYDLEEKLDQLASIVRENLNMDKIYSMLKSTRI